MVPNRFTVQSLLLALSLSLTHWLARPAQASSIGLNFEVPATTTHTPDTTKTQPVVNAPAALPIPQKASTPPIQNHQQSSLPATVYGGVDGLNIASNKVNHPTPLPPPPGAIPTSRIFTPRNSTANPATTPPSPPPVATSTATSPALQFGPELPTPAESSATIVAEGQSPSPPSETITPAPTQTETTGSGELDLQSDELWIFKGGHQSLVARVIGSAEGTRHPNGEKTQYYRGHTDPGNGVWNLGTFSYQHGASSPEEADAKQLARLQRQGKVIDQKAEKSGIHLDLITTLNALDLANQSPMAALNRGGYIDRMVEAQAQGLEGTDAILWARTNSYRYPDSQRWNAPGLGNTLQGVTRDQRRRMEAIESALESFQQQQAHHLNPQPEIALSIPAPDQNSTSETSTPNALQSPSSSVSASNPIGSDGATTTSVNPEQQDSRLPETHSPLAQTTALSDQPNQTPLGFNLPTEPDTTTHLVTTTAPTTVAPTSNPTEVTVMAPSNLETNPSPSTAQPAAIAITPDKPLSSEPSSSQAVIRPPNLTAITPPVSLPEPASINLPNSDPATQPLQ